jgi:glycosyltransferase involved in cell wall biosynthesis
MSPPVVWRFPTVACVVAEIEALMKNYEMRPVSVVMATYNGERFIKEQLASISRCLRDCDELVVVDDCSSDRTAEILDEHHWQNKILIRNSANLGVRKSFEIGLARATAEIVFLSDQDDVWLPGKRDAFVAEFVADPRCAVTISDAKVIDAGGRVIEASFMRTRGGFRSDFFGNLVRNRYLGCSMAVRRSTIAHALPMPRHIPMHDMWLGIVGCLTGEVHYIERPYLLYRRHGGNLSPSSRRGWLRILIWRLQLLISVAHRIVRPDVWRALRRSRRARRFGRKE